VCLDFSILSIGIASKKYFPLKFIGDPFSIIKVPLLTPTAGVGNYGQQKYNATVNADKLSVGYNLEKWGNVDTLIL